MHLRHRTGLALAAVAGVGTAFAAGIALGANGSTAAGLRPDRPTETSPVRLVNADLRSAASCDELLQWYVDRAVDRVTPYGWDYPVFYAEDAVAGGVLQDASVPATPVPATTTATSSDTGTNVQEAGVDEPDLVKTDGRLLVRVLDGRTLEVYDVTGAEPVRLGSLSLPDLETPELLLSGDRVVVIGADRQADVTVGERFSSMADPDTTVLVIDLSDPNVPSVTSRTTYDSTLVAARQHGDVVRLVLSAGLPELDFVQPGALRSEASALRHNREVVQDSTIADWLPQVTTEVGVGSGSRALLDCDAVAIPEADAGLGTMSVVGLTAADPGTARAIAVTTESRTVYMSADELYLASAPPAWGWGGCCWAVPDVAVGPDAPEPTTSTPEDAGTTTLYAFDLSGTDTTYAASGRVEGLVADRWAMDESGGVLRVAVGPTQRTGNFNSILTLARAGDDLVEIGRVDKLGVGEQIKSVRWFDDLAVMVTFRQTDPFYAIDLADPEDPRLLGVLKVPGFSSYLHPLGSHRMIGIGSAASASTGIVTGAKASLLDVSDLTAPRQLDTVDYPRGSVALAGLDPRSFTWLPDQRTALTVLSEQGSVGATGYVSVLRVDDSGLSDRLVEVEYGDEVDDVRLVPLPDGRVVLATGDAVSFFAL